ncbi:unnamed protein product [Cuscuta epithymum]|uniref:Pectin acetylesterase n=2 Tax=Cuscuta epithymum TaxID=186058 RepID=A0AAV0CME1_9ASTE|nr:unnamed protein product [Cuscuta epithymum]
MLVKISSNIYACLTLNSKISSRFRSFWRMENVGVRKSVYGLACFMLIALRTEGFLVDITYVESAVPKGAVCLDGSPPAYHMDRGSGAGVNNWLINFEGGGWCNNVTDCLARRDTRLGSSTKMEKQIVFSGLLGNHHVRNRDFYNWNRVRVRYCDGSSYTGDVEAVDPKTNLHFRGARVFVAVIDDLLAKGMKDAKNAVLSGCSAGGLTTILHCDQFKSLIPACAKVKCIADAGYFINALDVSNKSHIEQYYDDVVATHGSANSLSVSCTSKMKPGLCFFPQNMAQYIQTPIFLINAAYDAWQILFILTPEVADPHGTWQSCRLNLSICSRPQLKTIQGFRKEFVKALKGLGANRMRGYFINSCYAHCQTEFDETWFNTDQSPVSPMLDNKTIAEAVGDWYYDRSSFRKIDCPYPCDKTCSSRVY